MVPAATPCNALGPVRWRAPKVAPVPTGPTPLEAGPVPAPPEPGSFTTTPPTTATSTGTRMQRAGLISRPALRRFMTWAGGKPFILEITSS